MSIVEASCMTTERAAAATREVFADTSPLQEEIPDDAKTCAVVDIANGGDNMWIIVRGPSSLMP